MMDKLYDERKMGNEPGRYVCWDSDNETSVDPLEISLSLNSLNSDLDLEELFEG